MGIGERIDFIQSTMTRADHYLHKAEEFEAMAQKAHADTAKAVYEHLAWSYRQLGIHAGRSSNSETELDALAERMIGGKKTP